jgi:hypothetical protein
MLSAKLMIAVIPLVTMNIFRIAHAVIVSNSDSEIAGGA